MKTPTELKSMVTIKDNESLIEALTQVAKDKGFVWDGQVNAGEIRPHKLFRYLIETHPEVTKALSHIEAEIEGNVEQDYCSRCKRETPHKEFECPTRENPYEIEWVCMTCYDRNQAEADSEETTTYTPEQAREINRQEAGGTSFVRRLLNS